MKQYLIDTFRFNDWANKRTLEAMQKMPDDKESVNLFSHLIRAQDKWMRRIERDPAENEIKWFDTPFKKDELIERWQSSLDEWVKFLSSLRNEDLSREIRFAPMPDEPEGVNRLRDVVLQLNYHSILHRAQICLRMHDQGIEPPRVDYIYYAPEKQYEKSGSDG